MFFKVDKFEKATEKSMLKIYYTEVKDKEGIVYIYFRNINIDYIKVPVEYTGCNNCISIYHGENSKSGFWWDEELDYAELVEILEEYA